MNTEDYREQIAKALKEVHRQGLHEDSGNGEPCYCMVEPAILSLIESEKVKAVEEYKKRLVERLRAEQRANPSNEWAYGLVIRDIEETV